MIFSKTPCIDINELHRLSLQQSTLMINHYLVSNFKQYSENLPKNIHLANFELNISHHFCFASVLMSFAFHVQRNCFQSNLSSLFEKN